jgi:CHAT domain-containing protein/tetratricopeptide (TPR) repeat protein
MPTVPQLEFCEGILGLLPLLGQYRSGFLEERVKYESLMTNPLAQIPAQLHCRALLKLGIIAMLQGEPGYACTKLRQAVELSKGQSPDVHIQATAYLIQCHFMQFKWSAAGSNISSIELDDMFDFITEIKRLQDSMSSINAYGYWYELQSKITAVLELQKAIVSARPSVPTSMQLDLSRNQGTERVTQAIQNCRLSRVEEAKILPFIVELAHIYRLVGDHNRFHNVLGSVPLTSTDFILRAHYQLRIGDVMATTFGVPETWNMVLEQGTESNAQPRNDESTHFTIPSLQDLQAASSYYRNAEVFYRSAQYTRGQAAVQLRFGYLATLGVFSASTIPPIAYKAALEHVNQAKLLYIQAGDIAGVQVATAHSCLCRVGLAQFPEDSDAAEAIGQYGKEKGSYSLAFGIGLFFAKYARRWLVFLGDYEKALAAHKLAAAVFKGLELKLSYAYSICDQLSVYELLGDQSMIYITATKASNVCHEIEQEKPRSSPVFQMALNHAVHVLGKIFQRANKRADPEQLARVADRFREWRHRGPTESVDQMMARVVELQQRFQAAMIEGRMDDMGELLARLDNLNIDPVDLQTKGAYNLIDYFISTADTLVPLYNSRKAVRNGEMDEAESLWRETDLAIRDHPTSDSEILLASLSVTKRDFEAAAAHARAYESQLITAEEPESVGIDQETRDLLQRKKWQELTRVLSLFVRVRLYVDAQSILQKLESKWGPDWWSLYEYPIWENLSTIAQVSEGLGQYEQACDFYEQAMEAFDERRHALSVDDHKIALAGDSVVQDIYFGAALAAARWHLSATESTVGFLSSQIQRAFTAIERGKARSLLDLIEGSIPKPTADGGVVSQWQQYKVQGTQLATLRSLLSRCYEAQDLDLSTESRLKTEIQEKENILREMEGKLSTGGTDPTSTIGTVLTLPSLCRLLPADTALLQYCYSRENIVMWKITASGITEVFVADVAEPCLEGHILQYHKACAAGSSGMRDHDSWLGTTLLPFKSLDESRLIIVPYRSLHQLPFHTLSYKGQLLMSNKTISYLPSASVLGYIQSNPAPNSEISVLAVGNPSKMASKDPLTSRESSLSPLPSAKVEVDAIRKLLPDTMALTGAQATKEAVSAHLGKYRVLHFATHGSLSTEVPMLSAIYLSDGQNITVEDFMWRDLRAELVVLSACNTGRGDLTSGDDVIGFARVFLAAGVKSVLVSLWSVDDDVTSFLMTKFYENLKRKWSPAGALQAAQLATQQATRHEVQGFLQGLRRGTRSIEPELEVRDTAQPEDYSNPMYWAPFIVIGSCHKPPQ